jgi:hypothetical protein
MNRSWGETKGESGVQVFGGCAASQRIVRPAAGKLESESRSRELTATSSPG